VVDPDMLDLGDDATVGGLFQAHTFEERVLKIDRVAIRPKATVGSSAVLFYGSEVGEGARVAPHGVVMKRERLAPRWRYEGAPTRAVATAPQPPPSVISIASRSSPLSGVTLEPK
jgi:carbonic anhydrase/acetyltransferase-like protein (isoleucine patch superfamily)